MGEEPDDRLVLVVLGVVEDVHADEEAGADEAAAEHHIAVHQGELGLVVDVVFLTLDGPDVAVVHNHGDRPDRSLLLSPSWTGVAGLARRLLVVVD